MAPLQVSQVFPIFSEGVGKEKEQWQIWSRRKFREAVTVNGVDFTRQGID